MLSNHPLRQNEILKPSLNENISDQLLNELQDVKVWIETQQENGFLVAIVHLSGDLTHSAHISYMNTIRAKLRKEMSGIPFKLLVGLEHDNGTTDRKNKQNVFSEQERKYIFENMKAVDKVYIEFENVEEQNNDARPAGIVQFLQPDIFVSHEEHVPTEDIQKIQSRFNGEVVIVNYGDEEKYLGEESMRSKYNRSTTSTIQAVIKNFKDNPKYNLDL